MEVDSCSLVSILAGNLLEDNKIVKIIRRTEFKFLNHAQSDYGIGMLHINHQKNRGHPNITNLSDDPRRGGKRETQGILDRTCPLEEEIKQSNVSIQKSINICTD